MEQFSTRWGQWVVNNRIVTIIVSLVIAMAAASGGQFLGFTNDYRVFFSGDDPHLNAFEELQDTYTKNDNVLFVIAPEDGVVFKPETLEIVSEMTDRAWETPFSIRVDSLSNFQHTEAEGDDLVVADLYEDAAAMGEAELERVRAIALKEPFLVNRLISDDARVTAINITVELPGIDEATEGPQVAYHAREMRDYLEATYPDHKVYLTGVMMMNQAFPEASIYDMTHLIPAAFVVILLLVFLQLRGFSGTVATFITIVFSIVSAMGMAGWMGVKLTPPSMSAPTIILTLAVADCVHVLSNYLHKFRGGLGKLEAMADSLRINFSPVLLTSVTTAIGFLSLNFSDAPPFGDLGNISAMGVMFAWFYSVTLLPAMVTLLPARKTERRAYGTELIMRFADWVIARRRMLMPVMSLVIVGLVLCIPRNELNDVFVNYFDERVEFRTHTDFVEENLTGMYFIDYSLDAGESGGISNPGYLQQVEDFSNWLRAQPEVLHVNTLTDVFKRVNRSMHGDDNSWYALPENREMAAQYLLLYEMSLPYGLDLNNQIDIEKQRTRLSATLETLSTSDTLEFQERTGNWFTENAPELYTPGGQSGGDVFTYWLSQHSQHAGRNGIRAVCDIHVVDPVFPVMEIRRVDPGPEHRTGRHGVRVMGNSGRRNWAWTFRGNCHDAGYRGGRHYPLYEQVPKGQATAGPGSGGSRALCVLNGGNRPVDNVRRPGRGLPGDFHLILRVECGDGPAGVHCHHVCHHRGFPAVAGAAGAL